MKPDRAVTPYVMTPPSSWPVRQAQRHVILSTLLLGVLTCVGDYVIGPYIHFPVLFILPVVLASWYGGLGLGAAGSCLLTALRLSLEWQWDEITASTMREALVNALVYMAVLVVLAWMTSLASRKNQALQEEANKLQGILPICMWCKKIRDAQGDWQVLEAYIMRHSEVQFSHGLCPACMQAHYGDYVTPPASVLLPDAHDPSDRSG